MNVQQLSVKLLSSATPAADPIDQADLIPIFHRWIRDGVGDGESPGAVAEPLADEILIDVADYRHVPDGPGVILVAHNAHYAFDREGGLPGLQVAKKRDEVGPLADKLRDATGRLLAASALLAAESTLGGRLGFVGDIEIRFHSRLHAANDDDTAAAATPAIEALAERLFDGGATVSRAGADPREPLTFRITTGEAADPAELAARLTSH